MIKLLIKELQDITGSDSIDIERMEEIMAELNAEKESECTVVEAHQFIKYLVSNYDGKLIDYELEHNGETEKSVIKVQDKDYIVKIDSEGLIRVDVNNKNESLIKEGNDEQNFIRMIKDVADKLETIDEYIEKQGLNSREEEAVIRYSDIIVPIVENRIKFYES